MKTNNQKHSKYVKLIYFLLHSTLLFRKEGKRAFAQRVEYLVQAFSYTYILYIPETHVPRSRREIGGTE